MKPKFDFISFEKSIEEQRVNNANQSEIAAIIAQKKQHIFDPSLQDIKMYEIELLLISKMASLKISDMETTNKLFEYVFSCMDENSIKPTTNIKSRMLEYEVLNQSIDRANRLLRDLSQSVVGLSPVDGQFLKQHFQNCLQKDSFDGIAYLTNYCQKNSVSVANYDISQFKQLLDFYLNSEFNLNKVMVFVKFYSYYYTSVQAQILNKADLK